MKATPRARTGIGWRHAHERDLLERRPALPFIEVHSENFFGDGGAPLALLQRAREHYDVSLHGVGLALGSAVGLDDWHLDKLAALVERIDPVRVSDHASFARAPRRSGSLAVACERSAADGLHPRQPGHPVRQRAARAGAAGALDRRREPVGLRRLGRRRDGRA